MLQRTRAKRLVRRRRKRVVIRASGYSVHLRRGAAHDGAARSEGVVVLNVDRTAYHESQVSFCFVTVLDEGGYAPVGKGGRISPVLSWNLGAIARLYGIWLAGEGRKLTQAGRRLSI